MWPHTHQHFTVHQIPALSDNYIYLIQTPEVLAVVDPAEYAPVAQACESIGHNLTHILNTHHHWDHTGANLELKSRYGCRIIGSETDASRIPGIDESVSEKRPADLNGAQLRVLDVPGHTIGHIAYVLNDALFCGDVLFGAGCGRLFEGTPAQMWHSLEKIAQLPDHTRFYCAHEYTLNNLEFALHVDTDNPALVSRLQRTRVLRATGTPTIPGTLSEELATNPFLRPLNAGFREAYARAHGIKEDAASVFTHIRAARDHW